MKKGFVTKVFALMVLLSFGLFANTKEIVHSKGTTKIKGVPQKVVVFDHGLLDIANTLDVNVVGVVKAMLPKHLTKYEGKEYTAVGSFFEPNYEALFTIRPDVILISARQSESYEELSKIAPTVYFDGYTPNYFDDYRNTLRTMGEIFEKEAEVEKSIARVEDSLDRISKEAKNHEAIIAMTNGSSLSVYGRGSRMGHLYDSFGFQEADKNIKASAHGNKVSFEYLHEINPEYIFVIIKDVDKNNPIGEEAFDNEIIRSLDAYKNNKIFFLDFASWYLSSAGMVTTDMMVEEVEKAFN